MVTATIGLADPIGLAQNSRPPDVNLQIGVVQRFGTRSTDSLTLQAKPGDQLTVSLQSNGKPQTIAATSAKIDIVMQPLPEPRLEERVVLGTYRSFESAEDHAKAWGALGIPVEVAQPERWQVWAKRDVYRDATVRRLLLKNLQDKGYANVFLDTNVLRQQPKASIVVNGYRYTRDQIGITAGNGRIQVKSVSDETVNRLYAGSLRLQPNAYGTYTLVNQVPLETYLRGVVPHEIGIRTTQSVMEVQAILARTYALRNLRRFAIDGYQLCATTQCQVYYGLGDTHAATDRAIAATAGLVLTYNNELVDAVYSSTTGGVTASFTDVWQGADRPYLRPVIDSISTRWDLQQKSLTDEANVRQFISQQQGFNETGAEWFRWRREAGLEDLNRELRAFLVTQKSPFAHFKTIQAMQVTARSASGRVQKLAITTDLGVVEIEKDNLLIVFDAPNSIFFYLEPLIGADKTLRGYAFVGGGLGHGVGLSQVGSYKLGNLGWSSDRILSFYYPGTQLQRLNPTIVFWREPSHTPSP